MKNTAPPHAALQAGSQQREARRRFVVKAVFFIFILSLVEGPLRKWFLVGLAGPLTLLRDPFVLILYAYSLAHGLMLSRGVAKLWLCFGVVTGIFGLAQYGANNLPVWGWVLGVRTYWLYMPLALVVAHTFRKEDVDRLLKLCLWVAVPYSFLVAAQYNASSFAFINWGVGGDTDAAVGVGDGLLRPFGLFTYTGPNVQFTTFLIAAFVAVYVGDIQMRRKWVFLWASGAAVGAMSVLTGSRSIYFHAAVILGITIVGMLATRPSYRSARRAIGLFGFAGLSALLFVFIFPDMLSAMFGRFERASEIEGSILNRAFGGLILWVDPLFTAPLFGMGIGAGAPGVAQLLGLPSLVYGESDLQRNINELGLFLGIPMLMLRFGTAIWLVYLAIRISRRQGVEVLPLAGFTFLPLLMGQITHSPLSSFLVWICLGLILAIFSEQVVRQ
jgi:hypothetical protein